MFQEATTVVAANPTAFPPELISGVRSDVAVKVFGDDMDVLNTATRSRQRLEVVPAYRKWKVEQTSGLPVLTINIDREKAASLRPEHRGCSELDRYKPWVAVRPARCMRATVGSTW